MCVLIVLTETDNSLKNGENTWTAVKTDLDAVTEQAAAPVVAGVLTAADVFTASSALAILESFRLDLRAGIQVHP